MLNRVTLIGRLGRDPETRRLENGTPVSKFSLATSETYKDANNEQQQTTEWHEIVVWRQLAEIAEKILRKGALTLVEGKIGYRKITDKNGVERTITEIVASNFKILEKKADTFPSSEPPGSQYNNASAAQQALESVNLVQAVPTSNSQSVPFEVVEPANMSASSEPVGEDGLPF